MQMKNPFLGPLSGFRPFVLAAGISATAYSAGAAALSLDSYLDEVTGQSPALQAGRNMVEGSKDSAKEGDLVTMPRFFLTGSRTTDHRQFYNAFMGGRTTADSFNFGFEKPFSFGLNAKLSYNLLNNNSSNLSVFAYPPNGTLNYTAAQTQLDLNQSLWRNFFGKELRATAELTEASSLATHYGERFKLKQTLAQAETAYHRLAIANESVRLERELLDRSKKILDWTGKRVNNHLSDKIDLLQTRAGYQVRQISLRNALDELRTAALSFNQFRNRVSPEVTEEVAIPSTTEILALPVPAKAAQTDDVLAAEQTERIGRANQQLSIEKTLPDVSLFATAAFNGQNGLQSHAMSTAFTTNHPYTVFGLKLSVPLDFPQTADMRAGRVKQQLGAEQSTRQKVLENAQTWEDLSKKFAEAKERLRMADELVRMQKEKLEYEKYRFELGRTTTYQVLTFEQDYAQSLIQRLQVEREILNLRAQLKTYAAD